MMKRFVTKAAILLFAAAAISAAASSSCSVNNKARVKSEKKAPMCGAYTDPRDPSAEEIALLLHNVADKSGLVLTPLSVATQVVAGVNYKFRCSFEDSVRKTSGCCQAVIYKDLSGKATLSGVTIEECEKDFPVEIAGAKGTLRGLLRLPQNLEGGKCDMVIVCHGLTSHKNTASLSLVVDSLQARGFASVRFDFNGHGQSDGDLIDMTVSSEVEDAKCILSYVESLPFVGSTGYVGHSQGGIVGGLVAPIVGTKRIKCIALMAPGALIPFATRAGRFGTTEFDPANPPDTIWWRKGKPLGKAYVLDGQKIEVYEEAAKYEGPACIIHGSADKTVPLNYGEGYAKVMKDCEMHVLEGFDHSFTQDRTVPAHIVADFMERKMHRQ